ncbi:multiple organellar RNA editing factor 8, chloroplastic/mitochondrial [Quercus robur]|uniref:multiple organellar RNA editing factor 8, chloroplastic/mitochondrial n=1 Tax=Quercus robur TaxID=38942 RepID=UPI002162A754|nr:multiple organellar RNA editing factor 8, chloroplastic/mitochondrial [Quercus robur]
MAILSRSLPKTLSFLSRSLSSTTTTTTTFATATSSRSTLSLLRPLAAAGVALRRIPPASSALRGLATRATSSSLNDPNPNWSNRPPKETILLDGCDFEHWLVVVEKPEGDPTRDEIIDSYIKTLAKVVGSEEEARMKIYSVSTRCYYAFGALVSEELSYKIKELPGVRWVLPDSYLDVKNKDYGGEPFINGQALPYDPKYHEEWIRNNARANERNRRNDRPRNFDRSRNFDRRRENVQNRDFQNRPPMQNPGPAVAGAPDFQNRPPMSNQTMQNPGPNMAGGPPNNMGMPPHNNMGMPPPNMSGIPPNNNMSGVPHNNFSNIPPNNNMGGNNYNGMPPNMSPNNYNGMPPGYNGMPPNNMGGVPPNNMGGVPPNMGGGPPNNMGGGPPNPGWSNNMPNREYQNSYPPNMGPGGNPYSS